jgi:hypothetical protein
MKITKYIFLLAAMVAVLVSCEEDDERIGVVKPSATLIFDNDPQIISASYQVSGLVNISLSTDPGVTSVNVSSRYTPAEATSAKVYSIGSVPISDGSGVFSVPARTIYDAADVSDIAASATLAAGKIRPTGTFTLIFDAVLADGGTERRYFTAAITNSASFNAAVAASRINPGTLFNDSTFTVRFTVQNPANGRIANIKVFRKVGSAAEETTPVLDNNYSSTEPTIVESIPQTVPASLPFTGAAAARSIVYRLVATGVAENGGFTNAVTSYTLANGPVTLPLTRTIVLDNPQFIVSPATTPTNPDKWDLSTRLKAAAEDKADIFFKIAGTGDAKVLSIDAGAGTNTTFVKVNAATFGYATTNFNAIRSAFLAGTPVSSLTDVQGGDVFVVSVGDLDVGSDFAKRSKYKVFKIIDVSKDIVGNRDRITLEYKSVD